MNVYRFDEERARRDEQRNKQAPRPPAREPVFNLPAVVVWLGGAMVAIHLIRVLLLPGGWDNLVIILFAFWPIKYQALASLAPIDIASAIWGFVTYGMLHGGTAHIVFNLLWMAIFGSALARRYGAARFLLFSALCAAAGALAHLYTHWGDNAPMIGASAAVSGQMAGALRFVFEIGGPLGSIRRSDQAAYRVPAQPLADCFQNRQVLVFVAVWFGLNILFGIMSGPVAGAPATVAWQAHIGGFVAGLALFPLFDPVRRPQGRS